MNTIDCYDGHRRQRRGREGRVHRNGIDIGVCHHQQHPIRKRPMHHDQHHVIDWSSAQTQAEVVLLHGPFQQEIQVENQLLDVDVVVIVVHAQEAKELENLYYFVGGCCTIL